MDREVAVATLRRCGEGLAGRPSIAERQRLLELHAEALRVIEHWSSRHHQATWARAARVQSLERGLIAAGMSAGERAAAICARVGIKRSAYFKLRKLSR